MRQMAIFCDESGAHDCDWFVWGSVWCPYEGVEALEHQVGRACRHRRRELKWSQLPGATVRRGVVDWFFATPWVCFQALAVRRDAMRIFDGPGGHTLAYRKLLCTLLVTQMARFDRLPGGPRRFHVFADQTGQTTRELTQREFRILTAAGAKRHSLGGEQLAAFKRVDSRMSRGIQVADLLAGALWASLEYQPDAGPKAEFCRYVGGKLGWPDLRAYTPANLKFNVWIHNACMDGLDDIDLRRLSLSEPAGDPEALFRRARR